MNYELTYPNQPKLKIKMLISGGQTGVDQGALEAAKKFGLRTGGYAPRNYLTERGPNNSLYDKYRLIPEYESKTPSEAYRIRTIKNIKKADLTLILTRVNYNDVRSGTLLTYNQALKHNKIICIYFNLEDEKAIQHLAFFLQHWIHYEIQNRYGNIAAARIHARGLIINVAGERESRNPGIQKRVRTFLLAVFNKCDRSLFRFKQ